MTKPFTNVYDDRDRARAYAELELPGTYYLAFRADYRAMFAWAGLHVMEAHRPLGNDAGVVQWVSERDVSPWMIYVTGIPSERSPRRIHDAFATPKPDSA